VLFAAFTALSTPEPSAGAGPAETGLGRHVIYLHGRIVQVQQSAKAQHPRFGTYDLDGILDAFRARGFTVTGQIRPPSADVSGSADRVVAQVRELLESGVPADHIVVVGGSMGAGIALLASARLQNPDLRFAALGACLSENVRGLLASEGKAPGGRVLSIREASDESTAECPPWTETAGLKTLLVVREIVLHTGLSHGFLYRPLPEWLDPVVAWAVAP
jgi:pimeloyl-ACP methyl ester carboxylesterase